MRRWILRAALVILGVVPTTSLAGTEALDAAVVTFAYRGGEISDQFIDWVAEVGARRPIGVEPGTTLAGIVEAACGSVTDVNTRLLQRSLDLWGIGVGADGVVALQPGESLLVPPCLPAPLTEDVARLALRGETFWSYYSQESDAAFKPVAEVAQVSRAEIAVSRDTPQRTPLAELDLTSGPALREAIKGAFERRSLDKQPDGVKALWAFLMANDLVLMGVELSLAADAAAEVLAGFENPEAPHKGRMEAAMRLALARWRGQDALSSSEWLDAFKHGNTTIGAGDYFERVRWIDPSGGSKSPEDLKPGDIVVTPSLITQTIYIPIDGALLPKGRGRLADAYLRANPPPPVLQAALSADPGGADPLSTTDIELLDSQGMDAVAVDPVASQTCASPEYGAWGTAEFVRSFSAAALRSRLLGYRAGSRERGATLVVIDSGFVKAADNDGAFRDDAFGEIGSTLWENAAPPGSGKRRVHGTAVAGLALGGPELWGIARALGLNVVIQPRTIYKQFEVHGKETTAVQFDQVWNAIESDGDVYNMSFASRDQDRMLNFQGFLNDSNKLFVVAAGNNNLNDDTKGVDLANTTLLPQLYGGNRTGKNLITVAAFDGKDVAWFSNYSPEYVSIAAPGCAIGTWVPSDDDKEYVEQRFAGTSYSAPIVAHVAALIKALMPSDRSSAYWVRARLLASADLLPALADNVEDGRLLNPIKAISMYEDVVETNVDGKRELLFGTLKSHRLADYCTDGGLLPGAELLKFALAPVPQGSRNAVFYAFRNRELQTMPCTRSSNFVEFESNLGQTSLLKVQDIVDVVFRVP